MPQPANSSAMRPLAGSAASVAATMAASPDAEACRKAPGGGTTATPDSDIVGGRSTATGSGSSLPCAQAMRGSPCARANAVSAIRSASCSGASLRSSTSGPLSSRLAITEPSTPERLQAHQQSAQGRHQRDQCPGAAPGTWSDRRSRCCAAGAGRARRRCACGARPGPCGGVRQVRCAPVATGRRRRSRRDAARSRAGRICARCSRASGRSCSVQPPQAPKCGQGGSLLSRRMPTARSARGPGSARARRACPRRC